ncbi:MAG TPA: biotin carboxylase N-terminal domain-containing protein [Bdellovibrionota bacterium]|nr:biotin carboxylase N-terminal domain-containing protein [Bdellovibrionota bacterium]
MKKVLVANRGEIAVRIIRTIRECGFSPIAVYSDADRGALHVRMADEAHYLGASPPLESYLAIDKIVAVAKRTRAHSIHPGYGFLSENAPFARACERAKITFIGPPSKVIAAMGDKIGARERAKTAGVRVVPASDVLPNVSSARRAARRVGYPVLLKACAGGGGKGMRRVRAEIEMEEAYRLAQSEAKKAFADDSLYLERYLIRPRHIEVQIFADTLGNVVALGDRECSIQRRHQKIIEEAPAPHLSDETRAMMASAARDIARSVGYRGAATVEFLVDRKERFYFLEMNTRLQVEHPVTEWTTGLDLVAWQIDVAQKKPLPLEQRDVALVGHAMEARLYAEDPNNHFFPSPGSITLLQWPSGPGVRVDSGIEAGSEISLYYDPLLAKISVWSETRDQARIRLLRALDETRIGGLKTNLHFLKSILVHPRFAEGRVSTTFIQDEGPFPAQTLTDLEFDAALATASLAMAVPVASGGSAERAVSAWWRSGLPRRRGQAFG